MFFRSPAGGGHWDFRFCGFGHFLDRFFGFSVLVYVAVCSFFNFLAFGFRFLAKIQAVFRIWYLMLFSVFPSWFPVMHLDRVGGRASRITPSALQCKVKVPSS